jgi:uncharacterized protein
VKTNVSLRSRRLEWPANLSSDDLIDLGWAPKPITQFILKVHSRCNLACDYCYIYEMGDSTWQSQPIAMSEDVTRQAALRIREHAKRYELDQVSIVLHGGEPLMLNAARLRSLLDILVGELEPDVSVDLAMQTNGTLLTSDRLDILLRHAVSIGISLDGDETTHDLHRKTRTGEGSYSQVVQGIERLLDSEAGFLFTGFLVAINNASNPSVVYESLAAFDPPAMDFLLPHGNWTALPPNHDPNKTLYGDWLVQLFDYWYDISALKPRIRFFESIMNKINGGESLTETIGLSESKLVVIETNGNYELVDVMKSAYSGAAATELNVFDDPLDSVAELPTVAVRQIGAAGLSAQCASCSLMDVCGGGYFPHRYKAGYGFQLPSVYCNDLQRIIEHIQSRIDLERNGGSSD